MDRKVKKHQQINKKNDKKCFQYGAAVSIVYEKTGKSPKEITEIKPFISEYNREEIKYPSKKYDFRKFEKIIH